MTIDELRRFNEADQVVHPVETQWHYPIMTKHGYLPETKSCVGFVRSYTYKHPDGREMIVRTGASRDYWYDPLGTAEGLWDELDSFLTRQEVES